MDTMLTGSGFVTQPPPEDLPQASQSTLLLQKLKEMAEVQQQLDRKKEEFRSRMQRCQEKEVDLAARQEDIKEQVRKFDKFLKDNDAKRVRADRKVQEERKAAEQKEREKQELIQTLKQQDAMRLELKAEVEANSKYQRFLDSVVEDPSMSEYFEGIENITMRYETLAAAQADLSERVTVGQNECEGENSELLGYIKQRTNDLLVFNSEIASKQTALDQLRFEMQDSEAALAGAFHSSKEGTRQLGEIKMAIENIYGRCVKVRRPGQHGDHMAFLEAICERVCDLQTIVKEVGSARPAPAKADGQAASASQDDGAGLKATKPAEASATMPAGAGKLRTSQNVPRGSQSLSGSAAGASTTSVSGPLSKTIV